MGKASVSVSLPTHLLARLDSYVDSDDCPYSDRSEAIAEGVQLLLMEDTGEAERDDG